MLTPKKSFWGRRPGFDTGDLLHIGVNVSFVVVLALMAPRWPLTPLALLLVALSKWRIFSVQPRFWLPNLKANMVDVIVGFSTVGLMYQSSNNLLVAWLWALLYVIWLLLIKPQTSEFWVSMQALWAQLIGIIVVFNIALLIHNPILMLAVVWLITWSAARHFFSYYEEPHYRSLSLAWGFLMVQLAWISLHWIQYYVVFKTRFAAIGLIIVTISVVMGSLYHASKKDTMQRSTVIENLGFGLIVLGLILATGRWTTGG